MAPYLNKIIVVYTLSNMLVIKTDEVSEKLHKHLGDKVITLFSGDSNPLRDWRDVAVNKGLDISDSSHVLFMEQDFFAKEPDLFIARLSNQLYSGRYDAIGHWEGNRFHPYCLAVRRIITEATSRNFSANPPEYDHFGKFSQELAAYDITYLEIVPKYNQIDKILEAHYHMNGLTNNLYKYYYEKESAIYKPAEFENYLEMCEALGDY